MFHLLFFNRSFYPDVEATGQLLTELCEALAHDYGYRISVIAGRGYYEHYNGSHEARGEDGQLSLLARLKLPILKERYRDISILRILNTAFPKKFFLGRLVNLATYFVGAWLAAAWVRPRPDLVISETDPPLIGLVALFYSRLYRCPFVFYCHDIYPEIGTVLGKIKNPIIIHLLQLANRLLIRHADRVVVLGVDMAQRVIDKGADPSRVDIVPNWIDTSLIQPLNSTENPYWIYSSLIESVDSAENPENFENPFRREHSLEGKFVVMYSGNLGFSQGLEKVLEAARRLKNEPKIHFLFIGSGASRNRLITLAEEYQLTNVQFLPYQPKEQLKYSLSAADLHLIPLQPGLTGLIVPSKVYGILAASRAFIAVMDSQSDIAKLAETYSCGIVIKPGDVEALVDTIRWAYQHPQVIEEMGKRGREVAVRQFDRALGTARFASVIKSVFAKSKPKKKNRMLQYFNLEIGGNRRK